jgi:SNF2 family DNA or RNA helicase
MFNSISLQEGGILLTTYDIVRNNYKLIRGNSYNNNDDDDDDEGRTLWNYIILDEGHLIKNNKTQRAQSLYEIPCAHRIVISGAPIQNNLKVSIIPFLDSCNFVFYMFCK